MGHKKISNNLHTVTHSILQNRQTNAFSRISGHSWGQSIYKDLIELNKIQF